MRREQFAHPVVKAQIENRRRTRRARERRLIDHHYLADAMRAGDRLACAEFLIGGVAFGAKQVPIKHIVNKRGFSGA